ncbi:RNA polymerase II C-terminal domain phosphatase-like 4 [Citrus sinensis]|uniref:RNA polymerase II C-terminal domain phosphatase-like 4 n=1 Tax=Citrus sinensis TaxID=2711 RepID=A0ACB8IJ48_CITSI|nr:RNA polymerase II C-terminal domain phosphatase-like 4 [Citrus sinensis]
MDAYSYKHKCVRKTKFVNMRRCGDFVGGVDSCSFEQILSCTHSTSRDRRCIFCNQAVVDSFSLSFDYILAGLQYSEEETLLRKRKLHLVLDLDHTLLHCQRLTSLSSGEKYLKKRVHSFNDSLFQMDDDGLVKLRPFVHAFLEQTSSLFEIYVCTMGTRCYAKEAVKLLDPDSKYLSSRIIGLVKDKEMKSDHKFYSETWTNEILKTVHKLFFDSGCGDVRTYFPKCCSRILSSSRAEEMKATCTIVIDFSVTHLVSAESEDCQWAEQEAKFLVHPRWIDACYFPWRRQPEDDYLP